MTRPPPQALDTALLSLMVVGLVDVMDQGADDPADHG
jgi:hypothetical protein